MKIKNSRWTSQRIMNIISFIFFLWFITVFLILPNIHTVWTVFHRNGQFTLESLIRLLQSPKAMRSLKNSFILGPALSITVGIVGISLVLITEYFDVRGAKILRLGYMTTLIYGGIILASGYKFIYGNKGFLTRILVNLIPDFPTDWFHGFGAVLFVMTFACTSNHMIFLRNAMRTIDFQTVEAAQNMGASSLKILFRVVLPVLTPSLLAVTILTFITGLSATSVPLLLGGTEFQTITPMILSFSNNTSSKDLAALLSLLLGLATIVLFTIMIQIEKRGHYMSVSKVKTTIVKQKIRNPVANILVHIYAYVLFLIYLFPVVLVILFSFMDAASIAKRELDFTKFTLNNYKRVFQQLSAYKPFLVSIVYSALSALAVAVLVLFACRIIQKERNRFGAALEYGMLIPWLLPSTMIAMGLITTYNQPHPLLFGKVLTGSYAIMFIGYVIIKIPFTLRMTKAAFFALDDSLEDAAKNLGAKRFYTFFRVILPIVMPTVLAILALNFNSLLGDYDMSVFVYHPLNQPLGVYIKSLTDAQTNADNSALTFVYAVLLMIISAVVLYFVYGRGESKVNENL